MKLKVVGGADYEAEESEIEMQECPFDVSVQKIEDTITQELTALCAITDREKHSAIGNAMAAILLQMGMAMRTAAVVDGLEIETATRLH